MVEPFGLLHAVPPLQTFCMTVCVLACNCLCLHVCTARVSADTVRALGNRDMLTRAAGERKSLAAAGGVGALLLVGAGGSLLLRATLAVGAAFGLLLWRARSLRGAAACSLQSFPIACD